MAAGAAANIGLSVLGIGFQGQQAQKSGAATGEALTLSSIYQKNLYEQGLGLTEPFRNLGLGAVPEFRKILETEGLLPSSQLRLEGGIKSLKMRQAARGKLRSGETARDVSTITESVVTEDVNERLRRLLTAANLGTSLATQGARLSTQTGTNIGNILMGGASSLADIYGAQGQAVSSGLSTLGQGIQTQSTNKQLQEIV